MAAEQILGVFGDPYGGPPALPCNAPSATLKGATARTAGVGLPDLGAGAGRELGWTL